MAERAQVSSIDAIAAFRNHLIVYMSKARAALEEVSADVLRMRSWLENDQRAAWEGQYRRRAKDLEQAQAALFSAKLGNLRKETAAELMLVTRCKRSLDEAEAKLRTLKLWNREFDSRVQPQLKLVEKLHTILSNDLLKAVQELNQMLEALHAYTETTLPEPDAPATLPKPGGIP
jgi:hypothetical protein